MCMWMSICGSWMMMYVDDDVDADVYVEGWFVDVDMYVGVYVDVDVDVDVEG